MLKLHKVSEPSWIANCMSYVSIYRADIIKIEHPTRGDDTRAWGPPYAEAKDGLSDGQSAYFLSVSFTCNSCVRHLNFM